MGFVPFDDASTYYCHSCVTKNVFQILSTYTFNRAGPAYPQTRLPDRR